MHGAVLISSNSYLQKMEPIDSEAQANQGHTSGEACCLHALFMALKWAFAEGTSNRLLLFLLTNIQLEERKYTPSLLLGGGCVRGFASLLSC